MNILKIITRGFFALFFSSILSTQHSVVNTPFPSLFISSFFNVSLAISEHARIEFTTPKITLKQSSKTLKIEVIRSGFRNAFVSAAFRSNSLTDEDQRWYHNLAGNVEFKPNQVRKFVEFSIPQVPYEQENQEFSLNFIDLIGEFNPKYGDIKSCAVLIINDIPLPRITFLQKEVTEYQTTGHIKIPICRVDNPDYEVLFRWEITSDNPYYNGLKGTGVFEMNELNHNIEIECNPRAVDSDVDYFKIEIISANSAVPCAIGNVSTCGIQLHNDIPGAKVEFEKSEVKCIQSDQALRITVERTENIDGEMLASWAVQAATGSVYQDIQGEVYFSAGQNSAEVLVGLPRTAQTCRQERFNVYLSDLQAEEATRIGFVNCCTVCVDNDVRGPMVEFTKSTHVCSQSSMQYPVDIFRREGPQACTIELTAELQDPQTILPEEVIDLIQSWQQTVEFDNDQDLSKPIILALPQIPIDDVDKIDVVLTITDINCDVPADINPEQYKLTLTILCDLQRPIISYPKESYDFMQTKNFAEIPVYRSGNADVVTTVSYEVVSDAITSPYAGAKGILTFEIGEETKFIKIPLCGRPRQPVQDAFRVILSSPEGEMEPCIEKCIAAVLVHNDRKVPLVQFEAEKMFATQTMGKVKVPLIRTEATDEAAIVQWYIETIASGGMQPHGPFAGTEFFDVGQTRSDIMLDIPGDVLSIDQGKFEVILLDPIEQEIVTEVGPMSRCNVTVDCDAPRPEVTMLDTVITTNRSKIEVELRVTRLGCNDVTTSVPYYATSRNFLDAEDNCYHGIMTFEPYEINKTFTLKLEQYPLGFEKDEIDVELGDPIGCKYPRLGENAYCLVIVNNDIPLTELCFMKPEIHCRQSEVVCSVPVIRKGFADCEVVVPWSIDAGTDGIVEFARGQETSWIELPIFQEVSEMDEVVFNIELNDMIECDYSSKLGVDRVCRLIVAMDRPRPRVAFAQSKYITKQSNGSIKIPVKRMDQLEGPCTVEYRLDNDSDLKLFESVTGTIVFEHLQEEATIELEFPSNGVDAIFEDLRLELCKADGPCFPLLGNQKRADIHLQYDIPRPLISFDKQEAKAIQSQRIAKIAVARKEQLNGGLTVNWSVSASDSLSPELSGLCGVLEFKAHQEIAWIELPLPSEPSHKETENVIIELQEVSGDNSPFIEENLCWCECEIQYDIPRPRVSFPKKSVSILQTAGFSTIPISRAGHLETSVEVHWRLESTSLAGEINPMNISGTIVFAPGETEQMVTFPLPNRTQKECSEIFKIYTQEVIGECHPFSDGTFSMVDVTYDVAHPYISIGQQELNVEQTDEVIRIPVIRSDQTMGNVIVKYKIEPVAGSSIQAYEGEIEIKEGETQADIILNLPDEVQLERFETVNVSLVGVDGDTYPYIKKDKDFSRLMVNWNVPRPLIFLPEPIVNVEQVMQCVTIPVHRGDQQRSQTVVTYRIESNLGEISQYHNIVGELTFPIGDSVQLITLDMPIVPQKTQDERLTVFLTEVSGGSFPMLDPRADKSIVDIDYNMAHANIFIPAPIHEYIQSAGFVEVPVYRDDYLSGDVMISWRLNPEIQDTIILAETQPLFGEIMIPDGETMNKIIIDIAKVPTATEREKLGVTLMSCQGDFYPIIDSERDSCNAVVFLDVPRPQVNIPMELTTQEQRVSRLQGFIEIPILREGFCNGTTGFAWKLMDVTGGIVLAEGIETFTADQTNMSIRVPIPMDCRNTEFDTVELKLVACSGDGDPFLGTFTTCRFDITNDIPRTEVTFPEAKQSACRSTGIIMIPVIRSQEFMTNVTAKYQIVSVEDGRIMDEGVIEFPPGESTKYIDFKLEDYVLTSAEEFFEAVITDCRGDALPIIKIDRVPFVIENDIPRPTIQGTEALVLQQSDLHGKVEVKILRTKQTRGTNIVKYTIFDDDGKEVAGDSGVVEFLPGQDSKIVTFSVPDFPTVKQSGMYVVKLETVDGDDEPLIDEEKSEIQVLIRFDLEPVSIAFAVDEIEMFKSTGITQIPIIRQGFNGIPMDIEWNLDNLNDIQFENSKGVVHFDAGQTTGFLEIQALNPEFLAQDTFSNVKLELAPLGEEFEIYHAIVSQPLCKMAVVDDIPQQEVEFISHLVTESQTTGKCRVNIRRVHGAEHRLRVPWKIIQAPEDTTYAELEGYVDFDAGVLERDIEFDLEPLPRIGVQSDNLVMQLEAPIFDEEKPYIKAKIGEQGQIDIDIICDVLEPLVSFAETRMEVVQSEAFGLELVVKREQELNVATTVNFIVKDPSGATILTTGGLASGTIEFAPGEEFARIPLPIKQSPFDSEKVVINVSLEAPAGDMKPQLGCNQIEVIVSTDIPFPRVEFSEKHESGVPMNASQKIGITDAIEIVRDLDYSEQALTMVIGVTHVNYDGYTPSFYPETLEIKFEPNQTFAAFKLELNPDEQNLPTDHIILKIESLFLDSDKDHVFKVGDNSICEVVVKNDKVISEISFMSSEIKVVQSKRICVVKLVREKCTEGDIMVPWHVQNAGLHTLNKMTGMIVFKDGSYETTVEIELPMEPQEELETPFEVVLQDPIDPDTEILENNL